MKLCTIIGARPQFIKAAPICRAINSHNNGSVKKIDQILVHTGQHYDENMSDIFFSELNLPQPDFNLNIGSGSHADQTGRMMTKLESLFENLGPDAVLVYGDTNSTLASSLVASKSNIPIFHIEAGLRSGNLCMPEEINRIITDRLSTLLFCPNGNSVKNLFNEGIQTCVYDTGDVMVDQIIFSANKLSFSENAERYLLLTLHRQETCESVERLKKILLVLNSIAHSLPVIFPVHPRIKGIIDRLEINFHHNFRIISPFGYMASIQLIKHAAAVLTDSGGVQKEAYLLKTPCVTLRSETEWIETLEYGWNRLVGLDSVRLKAVIDDVLNFDRNSMHRSSFGGGNAAEKIVELIAGYS